MVKIEKSIRKKFNNKQRGAFLVLQLHDELIFEVNKSDLNEFKEMFSSGPSIISVLLLK